MPIDAETFETGDPTYSIEDAIVDFLRHEDGRERRAYDLAEITDAVMEEGWSESNDPVVSGHEELAGWLLDATTVSAILDGLVDNGGVERRVVQTETGPLSYYRAK